MADVAGEGAAGYWSLDASDDDQPMVYIPGISREGNLRQVPKFRNDDSRQKRRTPSPAAIVNLMQNFQEQQVAHEEGGIKSASLKDLCPEDKRRIANLIKELARVSEEKEVTEERLKMEHKSFEKKIRQLEEENNLIITERETLQQQYQECQEMLNLYQKYLSEQQEKLTLSLSELSAGGSKSQQMPKSLRRPTPGELNGSYLTHSCQIPSSDSEGSCSLGAKRHGRTCASTSNIPSERTCASMALPDRNLHQAHRCASDALEPTTRCCLHSTTRDTPSVHARHPVDLSFSGPADPCAFVRRPPASVAETGGVRSEPANGKSLTEERKHELLLQKMELEIRKEQLQQMLAQQELKLLEKQQQLQQTRLDYHRSPPPSESQLPWTNDIPRASAKASPQTNGVQHSPLKPPPERVTTSSSSGSSKKLRRSGGGSTEIRAPSFSGSERDGSCARPHSASRVSRKDAATSPTASVRQTPQIPPENSPHDVCRYETSLIEMLEAVSPISAHRPQPSRRDPLEFSFLSPAPRSHYKPPRHPAAQPTRTPQHTEDPEESRLLEDIFFIC